MPHNQEYKHGLIYAFSAYIMWGIAPIYFKLLDGIAPLDIVLQRVIWSFIFILCILIFTARFKNIRAVLKEPTKLGWLAITALLIGVNWLIFIWAVTNGRMLDASLGYYINPIFNVFLGTIFLSEKLRRMQWVAVGLAVLAVLIELVVFGSIPWVSIALAVTFGFYGLLRKKIQAEAMSGLFIETLMLLPLAIGYLMFIDSSSMLSLVDGDMAFTLLIVASGVVTTLPLLAFSAAAIRIPLSTLGFIQYIGPSLMLLMAVFVYGEPLELYKGATFGLIWLALVVYSVDGYRFSKKEKVKS